jgi:hypothetical protein
VGKEGHNFSRGILRLARKRRRYKGSKTQPGDHYLQFISPKRYVLYLFTVPVPVPVPAFIHPVLLGIQPWAYNASFRINLSYIRLLCSLNSRYKKRNKTAELEHLLKYDAILDNRELKRCKFFKYSYWLITIQVAVMCRFLTC